jgi:hypothetical protein
MEPMETYSAQKTEVFNVRASYLYQLPLRFKVLKLILLHVLHELTVKQTK